MAVLVVGLGGRRKVGLLGGGGEEGVFWVVGCGVERRKRRGGWKVAGVEGRFGWVWCVCVGGSFRGGRRGGEGGGESVLLLLALWEAEASLLSLSSEM